MIQEYSFAKYPISRKPKASMSE